MMALKNKTKENLIGWAFVAPVLLVFLSMVIYPVIMSFSLSFTDWNFLSGLKGIKWCGVDNFVRLFTRDRKFVKAVTDTLLFTVAIVPVSIVLSLVLANMLNEKIYMKKFNRLCFFVPHISNMVALTAVFRFLFRSDGPVNKVAMSLFGLEKPLNLLVDRNLCIIPAICVMIYAGVGYPLIVYMAALQNVPRELYEASKLDGANSFVQFFKITLPIISPTTFYLIVIKTIGAFKIFTVVNVMGISGSIPTVVTKIYSEGFMNYDFGYASAISWVLVAMILVVTAIQFWGQKKWVYYE